MAEKPAAPDAPETAWSGGVVDLTDKKPLESKKWTAFMWIHSSFMAYLFFLEFMEADRNLVILCVVGGLFAVDILYLGGVYALDRYRMGVTDVVRAVKGKEEDRTQMPKSTAPVTEELPDSAVSYDLSIEDPDTEG